MTTRDNGNSGTAASTAEPKLTAANFAGADWKSVNVPKPTSGLQPLVGAGMLALRRKQK